MSYSIVTTYTKAKHHPPGHGYGWERRLPNGKKVWVAERRGGVAPTSIVDHTTNGARGSSLKAEAKFLRDSPKVSAHYLVGKGGEIFELLDPMLTAWHAGDALEAWDNRWSIGIEHHHTIGEVWTKAQLDASKWLHLYLIKRFRLQINLIDTHRKIALPSGRKVDPSDWSNESYYHWRNQMTVTAAPTQTLVIGVGQSASLDEIVRSFLRGSNNDIAKLSTDEIGRFYAMCSWLQVDAAFVLGVWAQSGLPYGSSPLQTQTHSPLNIETPNPDGRPVKFGPDGKQYLSFETFQLGLMYAVLHLKNAYGGTGKLSVEQIAPLLAPTVFAADSNAFQQGILDVMAYVQNH